MKNIPILIFSFIVISGLIYFSCNKHIKFPSFKYDHAILFTVDGRVNRSVSAGDQNDELLRMDIGTDGESFIDSNGLPIHSHYRTEKLNKVDIENVDNCINQIRMNDNMTTECIPIYRDVIIYYSKMNKPVAWLSICFECNKMYLSNKDGGSKFKPGLEIVDCLRSRLKEDNFKE